MATEKYFPFRSDSGDRRYSADDWAAYFALFLSDGVFYSSADKLKVVANEGMKVKVVSGAGFVAGRMYILETDKIITLDIADGVLNRIDRIVLRCDYANRMITTEVVKGSYSEKPTAPELRRNADVYELALADIYVAAGVVTITTANITDQRLNTALCGIVTGLVKQADTTEIFNQFQAYMLEFMDDKKVEFQTWFDAVKSTLEGDVAGEILNRIEELKDKIGTLSELKTENKTNLVNAINELAEKKPILLETMEEVEANTEPGKQADSLVIKELNNSLGDISNIGNDTYNSFEKLLRYYIDNGYLPDVNMSELIPTITSSSNLPSGIESIFSSSVWQSGYETYKAFDNNSNTYWISQGPENNFVGVEFTNSKNVTKFATKPSIYNGNRGLETFKLQASTDGTNYVDLTETLSISDELLHEFTVTKNSGNYKYYRLYVIRANGSAYCGCDVFQLYGSLYN